jgi:hypothetical protein
MIREVKGLVVVMLLVVGGVVLAQTAPNSGQDGLDNRAAEGIPNEQTMIGLSCCDSPDAEAGSSGEARSEPTIAVRTGSAGPDARGVVVYENAYNGAPYYMDLLPGQHAADDCQLTGTARGVCRVTSVIYNPNYGAATVYIELWTACPIQGGKLLATSPALSANPTGSTQVTWDLSTPVAVPETVWVGWRTVHSRVGPLVSGQAEVGYTNNYLYLSSCSGGASCYCSWTQVWGGLDVTIRAEALSHPGDLNCDGNVDFGDINPFVLALTNPAGYAAAYPNCNIMNGDINQDGKVDFGDINPFVRLLTNP